MGYVKAFVQLTGPHRVRPPTGRADAPLGSETRTSCRDLVVLVNQATETIPAPNADGGRDPAMRRSDTGRCPRSPPPGRQVRCPALPRQPRQGTPQPFPLASPTGHYLPAPESLAAIAAGRALLTGPDPVGARYSVTSCDLRILMDQPTEPIAPRHPAGCVIAFMQLRVSTDQGPEPVAGVAHALGLARSAPRRLRRGPDHGGSPGVVGRPALRAHGKRHRQPVRVAA
jgi:hypothetical protein